MCDRIDSLKGKLNNGFSCSVHNDAGGLGLLCGRVENLNKTNGSTGRCHKYVNPTEDCGMRGQKKNLSD